jgi:hypothetical protein
VVAVRQSAVVQIHMNLVEYSLISEILSPVMMPASLAEQINSDLFQTSSRRAVSNFSFL